MQQCIDQKKTVQILHQLSSGLARSIVMPRMLRLLRTKVLLHACVGYASAYVVELTV